MPDALTQMHRRIVTLERHVSGLRRRYKASGWQLPIIFDLHRYGGGRLVWGFDGHSVHAHGHNSIWAENNIDASNYACATYGGPYATFDGSAEYLSIADASWQETGTEELLVWGWCYPTTLPSTDHTIAGKWEGTGDQRSWVLRWQNAASAFQFITNATGVLGGNIYATSTYAEAVDEWHFVAAYFKASTLMRIYVAQNTDAELTIDSNTTSIPASLLNGTADLTIGATDTPSDYFVGNIGKVMGRSNVPSTDIDGYVNLLFVMTQDFYEE